MTERMLGPLPHWNLESVYPGLESPEFQQAFQSAKEQCAGLDDLLEERNIRRDGWIPGSASDAGQAVEAYLTAGNHLWLLYATLQAYVYGFVSTDSFNTLARRRTSELDLLGVRIETQEMRFKAWMGTIAEAGLDSRALVEHSPAAADHVFSLDEIVSQSRYLMSEAEETLAAELSLSGGSAWEKLQATVTSQIMVAFDRNGRTEQLPMSVLQNIVRFDPDEDVRRRAFEAEIRAWESAREPLAACMNGVKGAVNTLNRRRGRQDSLHGALDQARIDRETLEAMHGVMRQSLPMFQRYFRAKAKRLGKERLAWWDLFAPLGKDERWYPYDQARQFIETQFGAFSPRLAGLARRAFDEGWIDAEPRNGKVSGAFCMEVPLLEQSRVLANFDGSLAQLLTLAHELGHAFHNECQAGLTMMQRRTPMTLAETASIFNESLILEATLKEAGSGEESLAILETFLVGSSQVIVDIYSRFLFEREIFERRTQAELSADDFCEIMRRCQHETYGEGLDEAHLHPYMWAWKPHYYSPGLSYYNFPYAFGLLFGLGLYAEYERRGAAFVPDYEALLRATGFGTAADLAMRFGINLRQPDFWRGSMAVIEKRVDRYTRS
ncbi:MAG: M3 family oligoendopeptidase [Anaerolineales bacterium]|nr:M3 family oligoendopeptidase [Anaerolineales bacterium]